MRRVLIAEDNEDLRLALVALVNDTPDLRCVADTARLQEIGPLLRAHAVEVAVLDIELGRESSISALPQLKQEHPQTQFVIHSGHPHAALMERARAAGASAYVLKAGDPDELLEAVRRAGSST